MNILENIAVTKLNKILITQINNKQNHPIAVKKFNKELSLIGYCLDSDLMKELSKLSLNELTSLRTETLSTLNEKIGNHVIHRHLRNDFPEHNFSQEELIRRTNSQDFLDKNKILDCGHIINNDFFLHTSEDCPLCKSSYNQLQLSSNGKADKICSSKVLTIGSKNDVLEYIRTLLRQKIVYSTEQKEIVSNVFSHLQKDVLSLLPDLIENKENMALLASHAYVLDSNFNIKNLVNTATDILRLAVAFSDGDVSLKDSSKFKLTRKQRKLIVSLLNDINNPLDDMKKYQQKWKILAHHLHAGEVQKHYPNALDLIFTIQNKPRTIKTFNSKVEMALAAKDLTNVLKSLATRPGVFARKIQEVLFKFPEQQELVINSFEHVVNKLTIKLKLELHSYFKNQYKQENRYFAPKGSIAKLMIVKNERKLSQTVCNKLVIILNKSLKQSYVGKIEKQKVFIDPLLKNILAPLTLRDMSKSVETIARGSSLGFDKMTTLRMFLYWKENETSGNLDVDLSALCLDEDKNYVNHISFTNLEELGAIHSGDVRSAPDGASEFIDLSVETLRKQKIRYIVMSVWSYSSQKFNQFECFAGIMKRENSASEFKTFDAKTVDMKFDLTGDTTANVPLVIDLKENKIIWSDLSLEGRTLEGNKLVSNYLSAIEDYTNFKPNLYDIANLICEANDSEFVSDKTNATLVFDLSWAKNIVKVNSEIL